MNIFARELQDVLSSHHWALNQLYAPIFTINPARVSALIRSLERYQTVTLNPTQLEIMQREIPFDKDGEDLRRLRAAIIAEGIQFILAKRIAVQDALHVAELALSLLLTRDIAEMVKAREGVISHTRGALDMVAMAANTQAQPEDEIAYLIDLYEEGMLYLELARQQDENLLAKGYAMQAEILLTYARAEALDLEPILASAHDGQGLLAAIEAGLQAANLLH